jgi:hypothetical protein
VAVQVSGHLLRARYAFLRTLGEDEFARFLSELSAETRTVFETGPLETHWYPLDLYSEATRVADTVLGDGDMKLIEQMGRYSAEQTLTGAFRGLLFRFGNPNFALKRAAKAWRKHFDAGTMEVIESESDFAELRLSELPRDAMGPELVHATVGWLLRAIELFGFEVESHEVLFDHPDPGQVTMRARWI